MITRAGAKRVISTVEKSVSRRRRIFDPTLDVGLYKPIRAILKALGP